MPLRCDGSGLRRTGCLGTADFEVTRQVICIIGDVAVVVGARGDVAVGVVGHRAGANAVRTTGFSDRTGFGNAVYGQGRISTRGAADVGGDRGGGRWVGERNFFNASCVFGHDRVAVGII